MADTETQKEILSQLRTAVEMAGISPRMEIDRKRTDVIVTVPRLGDVVWQISANGTFSRLRDPWPRDKKRSGGTTNIQLVELVEDSVIQMIGYTRAEEAMYGTRRNPSPKVSMAKRESHFDATFRKSLQEMLNGYVEAALWSSTDNSNDQGGDPLDDNYSPEDLSPKAAAEMANDCAAFLENNWNTVTSFMDKTGTGFGDVGQDFWLTRNGHGSGFWDRGAGKLGDVLTKASKPYGSCDIYVGADGKLHI